VGCSLLCCAALSTRAHAQSSAQEESSSWAELLTSQTPDSLPQRCLRSSTPRSITMTRTSTGMGASPRAVVPLGDQRREGKGRMGKTSTAPVRRRVSGTTARVGCGTDLLNGELLCRGRAHCGVASGRWEKKARVWTVRTCACGGERGRVDRTPGSIVVEPANLNHPRRRARRGAAAQCGGRPLPKGASTWACAERTGDGTGMLCFPRTSPRCCRRTAC
jgi:hypothetical protein